jgi:hypothetical protein
MERDIVSKSGAGDAGVGVCLKNIQWNIYISNKV